MATADAQRRLRENPLGATAILTVVGYVLVIGTFLVDVPIYPDLTLAEVNALTHAIAVINAATTVLLVAGWYWIRNDEVDKHRLAMVGAFGLILLFLVVYLVRVGGGGEKYITGVSDPVYYSYLAMLGIHILLSIVAVPVVLYALILGLTHTPAELRGTAHASVGRIAAASWILSLVLGVVTYVMLNHIYAYEFEPMVIG
ncbi:DUF420 domain-containing protein [Natrialbaceae archaeon AArc-T1-2]|uniref:DUF420 domain-containing protein n=1 Tax=Natrialbaceae archaeon AArc-T1-2 TaxID=3053904 RepID=UPI00255AABC8|nr:DUF420 domain-containing protein [Natrialbaceae archaeon AArc-T1-2]WIV67043.1 DUF420 domain-containing protein [Natrialbaceae archaeon AArc-T1-2]